MSEPVKLASILPKHEALNGLYAIAGQAVGDPHNARFMVVAILDVKTITTDLDTGDVVPQFRVLRIEPTEDTAARRLLQDAHDRRTGSTSLPLDLDDTYGADVR